MPKSRDYITLHKFCIGCKREKTINLKTLSENGFLINERYLCDKCSENGDDNFGDYHALRIFIKEED